MKTTIHTDGFEGWKKRARANANALDKGRKLTPAKSIAFESAAEMARLLTPARLLLFECLKAHPRPMKELATSLKRDVRAVRRDVSALEKYGIVKSEQIVNPGHGRIRVVSAPAGVKITALLWDAKAQSNERKHGVTFTEAATVLSDPEMLIMPDTESDRW